MRLTCRSTEGCWRSRWPSRWRSPCSSACRRHSGSAKLRLADRREAARARCTGAHERVRGALVVAQVSVGLVLLCGASILGGWIPPPHATRSRLPARQSSDLQDRAARRALHDRQADRVHRPPARAAGGGAGRDVRHGRYAAAADRQRDVGLVQHRGASRRSERAAILEHGARGARATSGPSARPSSMGRDFTTKTTTGAIRGCWSSTRRSRTGSFPAKTPSASASNRAQHRNRDPRGATVFREIVGIAGNARQSPGGRDPEPIYYFPIQADAVGAAVGDRARRRCPAATIVPDVRHDRRRARSAGAGARRQDDDRHVCRAAWRRRDF